MDVAGIFSPFIMYFVFYPAPYDRAKVTCVCVYSNLRFLKKIKAMVVRMAVTMRKFSVCMALGEPTRKKSAVFLNIVQKAFDPPPLLFEHLSYFAGGVF